MSHPAGYMKVKPEGSCRVCQLITTGGNGMGCTLAVVGRGTGVGPRSGVGSGVPGGVKGGSGKLVAVRRKSGVGKPIVGYANVAVAAASPGALARGVDSALKTANDSTAINRTAIAATIVVFGILSRQYRPRRD